MAQEVETPPVESKKKRDRRVKKPYKLDAKVIKELLGNTKIGCPVEVACSTAGITKMTLYLWLQRGLADERTGTDSPVRQFRRDYKRALHVANRMAIQGAFAGIAGGNADLIKWWLSRRLPKDFGPKAQEVVMVGKRGAAAIAVESRKPEDMTSDEMARRMALLEAAALGRAAKPLATASRRDDDKEDGDPADDID